MSAVEDVPNENRMDRLVKLIGMPAVVYESHLFSKASQITVAGEGCKPYMGGQWELMPFKPSEDYEGVELFYWRYLGEESHMIRNPGGYTDAKCSPEVFSFAISIIVANDLCWHYHNKGNTRVSEYFGQVFHGLRQFSFEALKSEEDQTALYRAID